MPDADEIPFRILTIDGGGIKGLYSAQVLLEIERERGKIIDHFDLICGTSTGGLIALALAAGTPCSEIVHFYKTWGPKIFPDHNWFTRRYRDIKQFLWGSRYSNEELQKAISKLLNKDEPLDKGQPLKKIMLSDSQAYLCIPTVDLTELKPVVIKTKHSVHHSWPDRSLEEIGLVTSAAPTYFPISQLPDKSNALYADGGIFANNPAFVGILEALRVFVGERSEQKRYNSASLLSIASVEYAKGFDVVSNKSWSFLKWIRPLTDSRLINAFAETQSRYVKEFMPLLKDCLPGFTHYFRIDSPHLPAQQIERIGLSRADDEALNILEGYGVTKGREAASKSEVMCFFAQKKQKPRFFY